MKKTIIATLIVIAAQAVSFAGTVDMTAFKASAEKMDAAPTAAPALKTAKQSSDFDASKYKASDVATLVRLWNGYATLESRRIYDGNDDDANLLRQMDGSYIKARGIVSVEIGKSFPYKRVRVKLTSEDGQYRATILYADFLFKAKAEEFAAKFKSGILADAYLSVAYNYRRISHGPFDLDSLKPVSK